ncbi:SpoIIE family protein phosphatase [Rhodoflexus caldus]|uniref:SpoIIE family protein phosphatase n=1 Tax=Rhodoflexus caldus TaxID=2891236 RepID=UPI00202A768A|nr:SpoIIE family protein phosphatase [Rhodoflexus caldus]
MKFLLPKYLNLSEFEPEWQKEYKRIGTWYAIWGGLVAALFYPTGILSQLHIPKDNESLWWFMMLFPTPVILATIALQRIFKFRHEIVFEVIAVALFTSAAYRPNCVDWVPYLVSNIICFIAAAVMTILYPVIFIVNFAFIIFINITFFIAFCDKPLLDFFVSSEFPGFFVVGLVSFSISIFRYYILKSNFINSLALKKTLQQLDEKNQSLEIAQAELLSQQEEILAQRDFIAVQNSELETKNRMITDSIRYAQRIQQAILPLNETLAETLPEHFVLYQPRDIVSGDFYWLQEKDGYIFIASADCTGHGVPGAFMSMIGNNLLEQAVVEHGVLTPDAILAEMRLAIQKVLKQRETLNKDGMDIALIRIDKARKQLVFAGAKSPIIIVQNGELHYIKGDLISIGGDDMATSAFTNHYFSFEQPLECYLFSDGYQDQFGGPKNKRFGIRRLRELILEIHSRPMAEQKDIFIEKLQDWQEQTMQKQLDDIMMIGIRLI